MPDLGGWRILFPTLFARTRLRALLDGPRLFQAGVVFGFSIRFGVRFSIGAFLFRWWPLFLFGGATLLRFSCITLGICASNI